LIRTSSLLLLLFVCGRAFADEEATRKKDAQAHYLAGKAAEDAGDFDKAIAEFQKANETFPAPLMLYHLGEAYRLKGDREKALDAFQRYTSADPNGKAVGDAKAKIATLEGELKADRDGDGIPDLRDRCPEKAEDKDGWQDDDGCPDDDNDGDGMVDQVDRCPDKAEDKDRFKDDDGCPDDDNDGDGFADAQDRCPDRAGPDDGCPLPDRGKTRRTIGVVAMGAGGAALVAGTAFGLVAMSRWSDAKKTCTDVACDQAGHDLGVSARGAANLSTVFVAAGVAVAATGAVLYFTAPKRGKMEAHALLGPGVVGGSWSIDF
jgi:hypothetical protein